MNKILEGDVRTVSRSISQLETGFWSQENLQLLKALYPRTGNAFVVGITGSPGVGKSTLVARLTEQLRFQKHRVAILAVDPSSPFSGGAVLGDRIRMQRHFTDTDVFIRSMATRGKLGGLAPATQESLIVLDAAGYDYILLETVGVGQDEIDIAFTAHMVLVVLAPGLGDEVQTIKAGLMEISDLFVLNKADLDSVNQLEKDMQSMLTLTEGNTDYPLHLIKTISNTGVGIDNLVLQIFKYRDWFKNQKNLKSQQAVYKNRLRELLKTRIEEIIYSQWSDSQLDDLCIQLIERKTDPYTAVKDIMVKLKKRGLS